MTLVYRTAGAWGAGSGADLSAPQIDTNIYTLASRVGALEAGFDQPNAIATITSPTGTTLVITTTGGGTFGPFALPVATFHWRGPYAAVTYLRNDLIAVAGEGIYMVLRDHTGDTDFNAALLVAGQPAYQLLWAINVPAPLRTINTASYTPADTDANCFFRITYGDNVTITLPDTMPHGSELHFALKAYPVTVDYVTPTGTTIDQTTGFLAKQSRRGGVVTAKYDADLALWDLFGDLEPLP